ncbi:MAG: TMEM254 family protein [Candidatus Binataceae bacterium]
MSQIQEADWLKAGFYWMALAVAACTPVSRILLAARTLILLTLAIHVVEALYSLSLSRRLGAARGRWFWRTLLLGIFSLRRLQAKNSFIISPE